MSCRKNCKKLKKVIFESDRTKEIVIHPNAFSSTNVEEIDIGNNTYMNSGKTQKNNL